MAQQFFYGIPEKFRGTINVGIDKKMAVKFPPKDQGIEMLLEVLNRCLAEDEPKFEIRTDIDMLSNKALYIVRDIEYISGSATLQIVGN